MLHFGLAQVLDARGEYAEAAEHLERGNALQLSEWRSRGQEYDPEGVRVARHPDDRGLHAGFLRAGPRLRAWRARSRCSSWGCRDPARRSSSRSWPATRQVFGAGEIKLASDTMAALGGPGARRRSRAFATWTARRPAVSLRGTWRDFAPSVRTALRIVDKMPENYLYLGLLASLFPRAKFIHCRRDLRDVAVSCWMTHFREVRWANDQEHIASRFHEYQRIMEHWRKVLPVPLLEVDYEETVADLEGVARRLVAWCGLAWEPGCLEFHRAKRPVRTASAVQVRQPVYQTSVGRWKHYEQALAPLFARLESGDETAADRGASDCDAQS